MKHTIKIGTQSGLCLRSLLCAALAAIGLLFAACDTTGLGAAPGGAIGGSRIPGNVRATAASPSAITVSWSAVTGAAGYYVYRAAAASGDYSRVGTVSATSYSDTGLVENTPYYYKVSAYNSSGTEGGMSSSVRAATPAADGGSGNDSGDSGNQGGNDAGGNSGGGTNTTLSAPANVSAKKTSPTQITISWSAVPGARGYNMYHGIDRYGDFYLFGQNTSTSYIYPVNANTEKTYYFKVSAYNKQYEEGPQSLPVSVTITPDSSDSTGPEAPKNVTAKEISPGRITVSWSAVPGATAYNVYYYYDGEWSRISGNNISTSFTGDMHYTSGTTHYFKVCTGNSAGMEGPLSLPVSVEIPYYPEHITATAISSSAIEISWSVVSGAARYSIFSTTVEGNYPSIFEGTTADTTFIDTDILYGTCAYRVLALNSEDFYVGTSSVVAVTTLSE